MAFFTKFEKEFYAVKGAREHRVHINLAELREHFRALDSLIDADDSSAMHKDYQLFNMLVNGVVPRGDNFIGKHGTGLVTLAEFTNVVEAAFEADQLQFKAESLTNLNDSIDFFRDASSLNVEHSAS